MAHDAVVHLIEDDEGVRQGLAFLLTASGFAVRVYDSAVAFLDALPGVQPGCVVTDVRMPKSTASSCKDSSTSGELAFRSSS